jgi:hypothetical protein
MRVEIFHEAVDALNRGDGDTAHVARAVAGLGPE